MASSSSSSPPSSNSPRSIFTITQEEFNVFHTIDRTLFARLVFTLGRDPFESTQVMGLWLWLEQNGEEFNLVYKMLSFPDALIDALFDEALLALSSIENDLFPFDADIASFDIPLIQHVSKTPVSLRFFHENRLRIFRGLTKIRNDICLRAFHDILLGFENQRGVSRAVPHGGGGSVGSFFGSGLSPGSRYVPAMFSNNAPSNVGTFVNRGDSSLPVALVTVTVTAPAPMSVNSSVMQRGNVDANYEISAQRAAQGLNGEISDVFSRLELNVSNGEDGQLVPPDERTIFLTFSKGYPISEDEVRDYFGRRYGNFIETIHMQEVQQPEEQPLYARLVVKSEISIDTVLEAKSKAKFSINGKHVWARKYVRKNPRSPLMPSSPPTPPAVDGRTFNYLPPNFL